MKTVAALIVLAAHLASAAAADGGRRSLRATPAPAPATQAEVETLEPGKLKVCIYPGFPPVAIYDNATAEWEGTDVDFMRAFAASLGLELEPVRVAAFADMWLLPGADACDVAAAGITITPPRVQALGAAASFSKPYYQANRSFGVMNGTVLEGVEDLADKTVVVTKGSTAETDLREQLQQAGVTRVTFEYTDNEAKGMQRVLEAAGDPDGPIAYGGGDVSIQYLVDQEGFGELGMTMAWRHCLMVAGGESIAEQFGFVVRAASSGLLAALDQYLDAGLVEYAPLVEPYIECPNRYGPLPAYQTN